MPTKDFYHDTVKTALEKDGWTVTDNLSLKVGKRDLFVDMGAGNIIFHEIQEVIIQWIPAAP